MRDVQLYTQLHPQNIKSDNIAKFVGVVIDHKPNYILMEYCSRGSLNELLQHGSKHLVLDFDVSFRAKKILKHVNVTKLAVFDFDVSLGAKTLLKHVTKHLVLEFNVC